MIASRTAARALATSDRRGWWIPRVDLCALHHSQQPEEVQTTMLGGGMLSLTRASIRGSIARSSILVGSTNRLVVVPTTSSSSPSLLFTHHHPHSCSRRFVHIEQRLAELQIILPPPPTPKANYNLICKTGHLLFVSGHLPLLPDGYLLTGKIGADAAGGETIEAGYEAARHCGLNIISTLKEQLGDLDRIKQIVKLFGIVQSTPDFHEQHRVVDGCSDLMIQVFGNKAGYHARSAIGTSNLPLNMRVEVEAIVELHA